MLGKILIFKSREIIGDQMIAMEYNTWFGCIFKFKYRRKWAENFIPQRDSSNQNLNLKCVVVYMDKKKRISFPRFYSAFKSCITIREKWSHRANISKSHYFLETVLEEKSKGVSRYDIGSLLGSNNFTMKHRPREGGA